MARSVVVNLRNTTGSTLSLLDAQLSGGIWTPGLEPPPSIKPGSNITFGSESSGFATGTEGLGIYISDGPGRCNLLLHWNNPFAGDNSYSASVSLPIFYSVVSEGDGKGNDATITWIISETSSTHDGIPDDWKRNGVDVEIENGVIEHIDLPGMGADVNRPDIFIQVDWMEDSFPTTTPPSPSHSHALSPAAIKIVVDAFKNAPYKSPTGSVGINLHIDAGPKSIMNFATGEIWGVRSKARMVTAVEKLGSGPVNNYSWNSFDAIKNDVGGFKSTGRNGIFRYCIMAHQIANLGNSGIARGSRIGVGGSDFIVSLFATRGATPSDLDQATTFMHELGHNLGLQHGGGDGVHHKPNYNSIMSYSWQFGGVWRNNVSGVCDYSREKLDSLDESALDESVGLGAAAEGMGVKRWSPSATAPSGSLGAFVTIAPLTATTQIDWSDDGIIDPSTTQVAADINGDSPVSGSDVTLSVLEGFNDWENIQLKTGNIGQKDAAGDQNPLEMETIVEEMTLEDLERILPHDNTPPTTTATISPPLSASGWARSSVNVLLSATDDISGVAKTEYILDEAIVPTLLPPGESIFIPGEGAHTLTYYSTDRSQNVEVAKTLTFQIDLSPPEAIISYDPHLHQILVTGHDALSGTYSGAIAPVSVSPSTWRDAGSDISETRTYRILDFAKNFLQLTLQVRCQLNEYEVNILDLNYNNNKEGSQHFQEVPKNTIQFRRVMSSGCCAEKDHGGKCLLSVMQRFSMGEGGHRNTIQVDWDAFHGDSKLRYSTGVKCDSCPAVDGKKSGKPFVCTCPNDGMGANEKDIGETAPCVKVERKCGLYLLGINTMRGKLGLKKNTTVE